MSTDIPPFNPDPRPGTLPDPAVPPFGPGTIPADADDDAEEELPIPDDPGNFPRMPPPIGNPEGPPPDPDD